MKRSLYESKDWKEPSSLSTPQNATHEMGVNDMPLLGIK